MSLAEYAEVIAMTTQFEFRLIGGEAPEGELDADQLLAIVQSLKDIVTKLGRAETEAEASGRPPKRVGRVSRLTIGLAPGSTRVLARRASLGEHALDFDLAEEQGFDQKFEDLVQGIALDTRPDWVSETLASSAADLTVALQKAAPEVEFTVAGRVRRVFKTAETHRETWRAPATDTPSEAVTVVGRLFAVNLKSHRLLVQDDVGSEFALPKVENDLEVGQLIGSYVSVTGTPERDARGRLTEIHGAAIGPAAAPAGAGIRDAVSLDAILASAPGPAAGGIPGLTEAEANAFFEALRS